MTSRIEHKYVGLFLLVLMGILIGCGGNGEPRRGGGRAPGAAGLAVGKKAPPLEAELWINGDEPTAESLQGKVIVVDAWAHWCGPCRKVAPHLVKISEKYKDRDVVFLGLTPDAPAIRDRCEEFIRSTGITWVNGLGARRTLEKLDCHYFPSLWVIGKDGKIAWSMELDTDIEQGIDEALAAEPKVVSAQ